MLINLAPQQKTLQYTALIETKFLKGYITINEKHIRSFTNNLK